MYIDLESAVCRALGVGFRRLLRITDAGNAELRNLLRSGKEALKTIEERVRYWRVKVGLRGCLVRAIIIFNTSCVHPPHCQHPLW